MRIAPPPFATIPLAWTDLCFEILCPLSRRRASTFALHGVGCCATVSFLHHFAQIFLRKHYAPACSAPQSQALDFATSKIAQRTVIRLAIATDKSAELLHHASGGKASPR